MTPQAPYIDERAKVHGSAVLDEGVTIWAFASVHMGVHLGKNVGVGEHTYIGPYARVGERTRIGQGCFIVDHLTIGTNVFIAPHVCFTNDRYPIPFHPTFKREDSVVEDDVSIGMNATILPGVRLGRGCRVGAGAVVTRDVAPYTTVVGNPAKVISKNQRAAADTGAKEITR